VAIPILAAHQRRLRFRLARARPALVRDVPARAVFGRIVASGWANFERVK
jgi:hypothetical protein